MSLRARSCLLIWSWLTIPLTGCTATRAGAVAVEGERVSLRPYGEGAPLRLHLGEEGEPLRGASSVIVEVQGPTALRHLWVRDWRVLDAGDGSGGFVGRLVDHGARLLLEDRNTHSTVLLDDRSAQRLRAEGIGAGAVLLVTGHVVGGGIVEVMAYRVLLPAPR